VTAPKASAAPSTGPILIRVVIRLGSSIPAAPSPGPGTRPTLSIGRFRNIRHYPPVIPLL
jgi:hypothetical protein